MLYFLPRPTPEVSGDGTVQVVINVTDENGVVIPNAPSTFVNAATATANDVTAAGQKLCADYQVTLDATANVANIQVTAMTLISQFTKPIAAIGIAESLAQQPAQADVA